MAESQQTTRRSYLAHVEGLRGASALYVFAYHLWQTMVAHAGAPLAALLPLTAPVLQYGHYAVAAFIVISGYCLGLPVAGRLEDRFDARRFALRRARRLGPAYVLVLFASVAPFWIAAALDGKHPPIWHVAVAIGAHLVLVHNWIPALAEYLNGPMWSVALECQIYVVFALLLVPLWRRFGPWAQAAAAFALGFAPLVLSGGKLAYTCTWLLALFALGVASAHAVQNQLGRSRWWRTAACMTGLLAVVAMRGAGEGTPDAELWRADLAVGAAIALLFVTAGRNGATVAARCLSARPLVAVGLFSYSLYLIHGPLVDLAVSALRVAHAGVALSLAAMALFVPTVLGLAYVVYRIAERPFLAPELRARLETPQRLHVAPDAATPSHAAAVPVSTPVPL